jgi:hypothetical protein
MKDQAPAKARTGEANMKRAFILAMLLALSACGRAQPAKVETAAPSSLKEQADTMDLGAVAQLAITQVRSGPGGPRPCDMVNETYDVGVIPQDVAAQTVLAQHVGARGFAVRCRTRGQAKEDLQAGEGEWLVLLPADSMTAVVVPCLAEPEGVNVCWSRPPLQAPVTTPASAPAPAAP